MKGKLRSYKISGNIKKAYAQIEVVSKETPRALAERFREKMRATSVTIWVRSEAGDYWVCDREL